MKTPTADCPARRTAIAAAAVAAILAGSGAAAADDQPVAWTVTPIPESVLAPEPDVADAEGAAAIAMADSSGDAAPTLAVKGPPAVDRSASRPLRRSDYDNDRSFVRFSQPVLGTARRYLPADTVGGGTDHGTPEVVFVPQR